MALYDIQELPANGAWMAAQSGGADLPPGDYSILPEDGNARYAIAATAPDGTTSRAHVRRLQMVNVTIGAGEKLWLLSAGASQVNILG